MSEYQYYEFQAIDKPLTSAEQAEIRKLSSRVQPTPYRASFVYNYSDFPGEPLDILAKYYDIMLYMANWGSRQLAMRFPKGLIDKGLFQQYEFSDYTNHIALIESGNYDIIDIAYFPEGGDGWSGWLEGEEWLTPMVPIREQLIRGDMRVLYLAGLRLLTAMLEYDESYFETEEEPDWLEPPVPPMLNRLDRSLQTFVEFFGVDFDLISVAAKNTPSVTTIDANWQTLIAQLSAEEKDEWLLRLADDEPAVSKLFQRRLHDFAPKPEATADTQTRRTIQELVAMADQYETERLQQEQAERQRQRQAYLDSLRGKENQLWRQINDLIAGNKANSYDEAVKMMVDLRDLAKLDGKSIQAQIDAIYEAHPTWRGLLNRMRNHGLKSSSQI